MIVLDSDEACLASALIHHTLHRAHIWQRLPLLLLLHRHALLEARVSMVMLLIARCGVRRGFFEGARVLMLRCHKRGDSCGGVLFVEVD